MNMHSVVLLVFNFIMFTSTSSITDAPGTWSTWVDNGCTDTCGMCGVVQQTRICLSPPCTGPATQNTTTLCGSTYCTYPRLACCSGYKIGVQNNAIICLPPS